MSLLDSLMGFTCQRFARHVANGEEPLGGGLYPRLQFWIHWMICPFCRRYWKEIKEIGRVHRTMNALALHPAIKMPQLKRRLFEQIIKRYS